MSIFVIFRVADTVKMKAAVQAHFTNDFFDIGNGVWLVSFKGTAREVSNKLGVTSEDGSSTVIGPAIIVQFENYFGRANRDIWDWIKSKIESSDG